jgi:hypothetical protein
MLFTEYNLADALEVAREEGREDVWEEARAALADARAEIRRAEAERRAERRQLARKLIQKGLDSMEIVETTGLEAEAVTALFREAGLQA